MERYFPIAIICLFIASCSINSERDTATTYPLLGREPIEHAALADDPSGALVAWARMGSRSALTVVHGSEKSGLAEAPKESIRQIRSMIRNGRWDELERAGKSGGKGLFTSKNYLAAAVSLGIVGKIYWVVPGRLLEYTDAERRVREFLKSGDTCFRREEIDAMKLDRGCVSGRLAGASVSICSLETLPPVPGPALLDMDVDFFIRFSAERGYSKLRGFKESFDLLSARGLRVASAHIACTDAPSRSVYRYIGEQAVEALKNPGIMKSSPPGLWSARDKADEAFMRRETAAPAFKDSLKRYPGDRSLALFDAVSAALGDREQAALGSLAKLCREDEDACHALLFAGIELKLRRRYAAAERFLGKAVHLRAEWPEALREYGDLCFAQQRYSDAARHFHAAERLEDGPALQLALGDCYYFLGRRSEALRHYERGLSFFEEDPCGLAGREKDSLIRLLKLYEEQGRSDRAKKHVRRLLGTG